MTKYQQFLNKIDILSENSFNEVINSLPEVDINLIDFDPNGTYLTQDDLSVDIISYILQNWEFVYADDVDFKNKTMELYYVNSLKDLEEIKEKFSAWTIDNYDQLVEEFEEESNEYDNLIDIIRNNASLKQLKEFVNNL